MGLIWRHIVVAGFLVAPCLGQKAEFEVASVKPSDPNAGGMVGVMTYPGGRVVIGHLTLEMLIEFAYDVQAFQVSGGPAWAREDRFEIEARVPASSKSINARPISAKAPMNEEQRKMLQSLLADRFHLSIRRENRLGPVYILSSNAKPKMTEVKDKGDFEWVGSPSGGAITGNGIAAQNMSMPVLAQRLSRYLGSPVIDRTGIEGHFDFKWEMTPDDPPDVVASILTSIQGIGLKLKSDKGPVETIVIEHAEKLAQ